VSYYSTAVSLEANLPPRALRQPEDDVLHSIEGIVKRRPPRRGEIFIGDDAAVLDGFAGHAVVSVDVCVFGVHLDDQLFSLEDLGFKAVTTALSDLAAMGARARGVLLGVSAPPGTALDLLHRGAATAATLCDTDIVGGDLTTATGVSIAVTVLGECAGSSPVLRSGARAGDGIYVSGPLGRSAAGLRLARAGASMDDPLVVAHRRPWPRLREGWNFRLAGVTAMMDLSDGLSLDLHRLADASGVGFELDDIPVAPGATLAEATRGGEDYELLFTTNDDARLRERCRIHEISPPLRIGTVVADSRVRRWRSVPLERAGWQHQL